MRESRGFAGAQVVCKLMSFVNCLSLVGTCWLDLSIPRHSVEARRRLSVAWFGKGSLGFWDEELCCW